MEVAFFQTIQTIPEDDVPTKDWEFEDILVDAAERKQVFEALHAQFFPLNLELIAQTGHTYWKWYVRLGWEHMDLLKKADFPTFVAATLPLAYLVVPNIEEKMLYYLYRSYEPLKEMPLIFKETQRLILQSPVPLQIGKGGVKTFGELASFVQRQRAAERDIMQLSELYAELKGVLEDEEYLRRVGAVLEEGEDKTKQFLTLINFLVRDRNITDITFDHFDNYYQMLEHAGPNEETALAQESKEDEARQEEKTLVTTPRAKESEPQSPPTLKNPIIQSLAGDFTQIDQVPVMGREAVLVVLKARMDLKNQEHVARVYTFLTALAEHGLDMQDVLFFDEQSGTFKWES